MAIGAISKAYSEIIGKARTIGNESVDTSILYEDFKRQFQKTGKFVEADFRKIVSWVRLGDQLTHQIYPYPAKLLPHIAHFFVRASVLHHGESRSVLDPFCGSGTVALEASLAGLIPLVADANPLALLLTKVKTRPYATASLAKINDEICRRARRLKSAPTIEIVNSHLWYSETQKKKLEMLLRAVNEIPDEDDRDFFRVCFSIVAKRLSFADPAVSVPVRLKTRDQFTASTNERIVRRLEWIANTNPIQEFYKVSALNIGRVAETNDEHPERRQALVVGVDARELIRQQDKKLQSLTKESVPVVITSPPYGSAQKYVRASSLALNWLNLAAPNELSKLEGRSIGREHLPGYKADDPVTEFPKKFGRLLSAIGKENKQRERITRTYLTEMREAVKEISRVIEIDGRAIMVIGNNQVCGNVLRNDEYLIHCCEEMNMKLELGLTDHIKSRGLMTKRNNSVAAIPHEMVLVFKKEK